MNLFVRISGMPDCQPNVCAREGRECRGSGPSLLYFVNGHLSVYLSSRLPVYLSICVCLSVCLSVCLCLFLSGRAYFSIYLSTLGLLRLQKGKAGTTGFFLYFIFLKVLFFLFLFVRTSWGLGIRESFVKWFLHMRKLFGQKVSYVDRSLVPFSHGSTCSIDNF